MVTLQPFAKEPYENFCVIAKNNHYLRKNKQENLIKSLNEE